MDPSDFSARLTGEYVPEVSGLHRVGVFSAGVSRVFVDGVLVADAWTGWKPRRTFFEEGCDEVVGEVMLEAGRAHQVVVEFAAKAAAGLGFAGLRFGIGLPMGDAEIAEAVLVAAAADRAVVFVGRKAEWDTEGSDLPDMRLPGRQGAVLHSEVMQDGTA